MHILGTSLMQLVWNIKFPASFSKPSTDVDVEEKFFLHFCGKKRLDLKVTCKMKKSTKLQGIVLLNIVPKKRK